MARNKPWQDPTKLTRKVFDKHVDRMELKRLRDREDHRADLKAIFQRQKNLETQLTLLITELEDMQTHIDRHCAQLDTSRINGNEELE